MSLIAEIREKDVDLKREQLPDEAHINYRQAVRVVVFDANNNIALIHYVPSPEFPGDCYYLPGGGVEEETIEEALHREALEEVGCKIENIEKIGFIMEYMNDKLLKQQTHVFTADVSGGKGERQLTEDEISKKMNLVWKTLEESIALVGNNCKKDFSQLRSLIILDKTKNS